MPFSFPSSPSIGDQSTQNGRVYQWTGTAWEIAASASNIDAASVASGVLDAARLPLATTTQARDGSSMSVVVSASTARDSVFSHQSVMPQTGAAVSGGSINIANTISLGTGTNSAGGAYAVPLANGSNGYLLAAGHSVGIGQVWSRPRAIAVRVMAGNFGNPGANHILRILYGGKAFAWSLGGLAHHGIGVEVRGRRVWLVAHNGSALTEQDSGVDLSFASTNLGQTGPVEEFLVVSDGAGGVSLFRNNTQIASCTGGPTATTGNTCVPFYEVSNNGEITSRSWWFSAARISYA